MALKEQVSRSNLGSVSFNNGVYSSGACNLFGEMPESEWRSPSRVLEVTIHRAYYPITEEVLHLLFDPFGEVEHVHVLGGSDHLLAQVVFETKHAAAEAFGELHGRCVYAGCCQLDIKWGLLQECEATMEKSRPNTMVSSSSNLLEASRTSTGDKELVTDTSLFVAAATTADVVPGISDIEFPVPGLDVDTGVNDAASVFPPVETLFEELTFEKLYMRDVAIEAQAEATTIGAAHSDITLVVQSVADKLLAHTTSMVVKGVVPVPKLATSASSASDLLSSPWNIITTVQVSPRTTLVLEFVMLPGKLMLQNVVDFIIPASRCVIDPFLITCYGSMLILFPPPAKCEFTNGDVELRPMPWPSFTLAGGWTIIWFCAMFKKPPWPPPVQNNLKCVLVVLVQLVLVAIMSDRGQEKWCVSGSRRLVLMLLPWKTHALMSFDLAVQFNIEWCFSLLRQPPWPNDFCLLLILQDLGNCWKFAMGLPEAEHGIKAHSWPLLLHRTEKNQRARFWLARTIHVVSTSVNSGIIFSFDAQLQCSVMVSFNGFS